MANGRAGTATAVALVLVTLAGCASIPEPPQPPPSLTDDEVAEILRADADIRWSVLEPLLDGAPRPEAEFVAFATQEEWPVVMAHCMRDSGVESAQVREGSGLVYRGDGPGERIVFFACSVAYPVDPRSEGYLSEAQRGYLWDYWTTRTVPCLLGLGYPVPGVPERRAFIARSYAGTSWNPYLLVTDSDPQWALIDGQCPPLGAPYPQFH